MSDTAVMAEGYLPPRNEEAERAVLGAMMLEREAIAEVTGILREDDFYFSANRKIFDTIVELDSKNEPVDRITLATALTRKGLIDEVGGADYLHRLDSDVITTANVEYYARDVRDKAMLRRLVNAGIRISQMGMSQAGSDTEEIINAAQAEMFSVTQHGISEDYRPINEIVDATLEELDKIASNDGSLLGLPTGFRDLDELTNGFQAGQMIIVAARPAMGKSTLALDICRNATLRNSYNAIIFSLEMSQQEISMRLLSAESGVQMRKMQHGQMSDTDWSKVAAAASKCYEAGLYIDDSANLTMMEIRSKCRRLKQQGHLDLIVIDYLQLLTSGKRVESRQQEVSEFSRALKLLAKELEVPLIAVAQLNRGPEARTDHKPMLADLRESGSLEQDADLVLLLHRPEFYNPEDERKGEADIIVAKHRNGRVGTLPVAFQGDRSRFADFKAHVNG